MAKKSMGDKKKAPARSSAKTRKVTTRTTTKKVAAKKTTKAAPKKAASKKSVLEIADHAIHRPVSERVVENVKKTEHWHAGLFALVVIFAAYFSFQSSNSWVERNEPMDTTPSPVEEPVVEEAAPIEEPKAEEIVYDFPNDYAWLTKLISSDLTLAPGGSGEYTIAISNSGEAIWYRDTDNAFRLGTLQPADSPSPFMIASVMENGKTKTAPNRNRMEMMEEMVKPGEMATFKISATAKDWAGQNLKPGRYQLTVGFLVEGKGSLSKKPLTWIMNVR